MIVLSKEQVLSLHTMLINETGGSDGVRDEALLESAIFAPLQKFDGKDLFPTVYQKSSRLGFGLIKNHPFVDGNKRIGAHSMLVSLSLNGIELEYSQKELYEIILGVADSSVDLDMLTEWIINHQK
ncbi:MAG: type II toxin-antitoxin system death-on-curing family toxin [Oscillospiraceae bacterium]|nr:type II toxin-antitoxin system death-on-curing family toxin [Candidatus Ruminococcus equi]